MRIRKGEREQIETLLEQAGDQFTDEVAETVFQAVHGLLMERDWYVVAAELTPGLVIPYGPFESEAQARKAMVGVVAPGPEPGRYTIRLMRQPTVT